MEKPENHFAHQLVRSYISKSSILYDEFLRSPEADLRAPLVSNLISPIILQGTFYAENKGLIDESIRNLALKLIILFGTSWAVAYCKKISVKDVSLNLLPNTLTICSAQVVCYHLFPIPSNVSKKKQNAIREKQHILMLIVQSIISFGSVYLMSLRNPQIPLKSIAAYKVCVMCAHSFIQEEKYHETPLRSGIKHTLRLIAVFALDFAFQKTVGAPMIMSKRITILSYAGSYVTFLATHSQYSPLVKKEKNS